MKNQHDIKRELDKVQEIERSGESAQFYVPFEPGYLQRELGKVAFLSVEKIVLLKHFFKYLSDLKTGFIKSSIRNYFNKIKDYRHIINKIDQKIDSDNYIKNNASSTLLEIREQKKQTKNRIIKTLQALLEKRPHVFTDTTIVERGGRYVLPIKSNFKKDVLGIVHSYSNSGETVFIEPMDITDDSARLVELEEREKQEIETILCELTDDIRAEQEHIEEDIEHVVGLDLVFAKVRFAHEHKATRPFFGSSMNIINGYHPILRIVNGRVVPLNLKMDSNNRVLLISGPNAGGKTVVLKTVGLLTVMAKCGLYIPADEGSTIPFFDEVYADIGDEQSIESRLSTFSAHIKQIKEALNGNKNSLILLDELMSQTSVEEGSALAAAIMEAFAQRKSMVLATTHNENLKIFVSQKENMLNAGMEFTDRPTYRLIVGIPQASNALALARRLGMDSTIMRNAESYLNREKLSLNELFEGLSKELKTVQEERQKLSVLVEEYETRLQEMNTKKKEELRELKMRYKTRLIEAKRGVERLIKTLKKEGPKPGLVHKVRRFFDEKLEPKDREAPYYPQIGEIVLIRELKKTGQVVAEHQGKFKVSLDNIYYWVEPQEMESIKKEQTQ